MLAYRRLVFLGFSLFILALLCSGCGLFRGRSDIGMDVAKTAHKYLGTPYKSGGRSPKGFDCSGLVWFVYKQYGVKLPVSSSDQSEAGFKVSKKKMQPGDLIFFKTKGRIHHVGIYVGGGKMIHAPGLGKKVVKVSLDNNYYVKHFAMARRISKP